MNFSSGEGLRVIRTTDFSTEFQMTYIFQYLIDHALLQHVLAIYYSLVHLCKLHTVAPISFGRLCLYEINVLLGVVA